MSAECENLLTRIKICKNVSRMFQSTLLHINLFMYGTDTLCRLTSVCEHMSSSLCPSINVYTCNNATVGE
jgi:hypothetical protein